MVRLVIWDAIEPILWRHCNETSCFSLKSECTTCLTEREVQKEQFAYRIVHDIVFVSVSVPYNRKHYYGYYIYMYEVSFK